MALRSGHLAAMGDEPIAIVGASCRFPGADGLEAFWQLLITGKDAVGEVDAHRWATRFFYHPGRGEAGKSYTWAAGLIHDIDRFEPSFFGISPREAMQMDPQQRILLELVWHAFEDAGIPPSRFGGREVGVYIGASSTDYSDLRLGDPAGGDSYFMTGNALSILANRISHVFDLRGPSLAIDTACSSSLVALDHACAALRGGGVESAVVGGVNLLLTPYPFLGFCRAAMLSPQGRCFAFDERADGYVRGEGGGVVIVKRLADALADRDPVRAVILATGANSDGRTIGLSLPSETAQTALLERLYRAAGVDLDDIAFFEMHGTGTPAGDPVEAAAVGRAVATARREPLPIGSVKTNIGHLEPASGMAGLLKTMLALERGVVPASLHCAFPNPRIDFPGLNLRLVREAEPVAAAQGRGLAGINSFGFGGTNAHVVLAAPPLSEAAQSPPAQLPLVVSAAGEASLRELARGWSGLLAETADERLPALLRAAARGRDHHRHRLAAPAGDRAATAAALEQFLDDRAAPEIATGTAITEGGLAFVFSGNGAQFPEMGRLAWRANSAFRAAVEEVAEVLSAQLGWSVCERIASGVDAASLAFADIAQPLLFAIQVGIVKALRAAGVTASAHVGHSVGEIAAAWAAGALSLEDAAHIVIARSRSQERTHGTGRMAALALGSEAARDFLGGIGSSAEIAAFNTARSVTVAGTGAEIDRVAVEARSRGLWCRPLDLDFAFHSRLMEPVRDELLASLAGLVSRPPAARLMSTVTGGAVGSEQLDGRHWWRNIRNPVRFAAATTALIGEGYRIFVEIGPNPILHSYLIEALGAAGVEGRVLASLTREDSDADPFAALAARCYVAGYELPSASLFDGGCDPRGLPLYPWDRGRFWFEKTVEAVELENPPFDHPLLGFRQAGPTPNWLNHLDERVSPWIADHKVGGVAVYPAAAIVETALAAARQRWPASPVLEAFDIEIRRPLPFETGRMRELRLTLGSEEGDWQLASRPRLSDDPMTVHAVGRIAAGTGLFPGGRAADATAVDRIDGGGLYRSAQAAGLDYGPAFRTVEEVELSGPDHAIVHLAPPKGDMQKDAYLLHPSSLDGALQGLLALLLRSGAERAGFLPWRFGKVRVAAPFGRICRRALLNVTRLGGRTAAAEVVLYDGAGEVVAELTDCLFRRVELDRHGLPDERLLRFDLVPAPLSAGEAPAALRSAGPRLARLAATDTGDPVCREQQALLDALMGAAALPIWKRLVAAGEVFSLHELVAQGRVAAASVGVASALLRALEKLGAAVERDGDWRLEATNDLPDAGEIWRLLLAEAPELVAELALIAEVLGDLPNILENGPFPAQLPAASPAMVEQLLRASPASAGGVDLLRRALCSIAEEWPAGRPLRILEIAANPSVTRCFLQSLARSPAAIVYLAANPDPEHTDRLSALTRSFVGASAVTWRPGDASDALGDARFDVILASNGCTRLQTDAASLAALRELMVPGGFFVAAEPEPNAFWDIVFGRAADWWLPDRLNDEASPLRTGEEWQAELAAAGFQAAGTASLALSPWPSALFWGSAPACSEPADSACVEPRTVALVADDRHFRGALLDCVGALGHRVVSLCEREDASASNGTLGDAPCAPDIILFAPSAAPGAKDAARWIARLARTAQNASEQGAELWLVTVDAQQSTVDTPGDGGLAGAALRGFARVLANELPRLSVRLIDLAAASGPSLRARQIAAEIATPTPETEIVWTPQGRHVLRLRVGCPPQLAEPDEGLRLAGGAEGDFAGLGWEVLAPRTAGRGEVEIDVRAAGLNFRDVMWAMGLLPEEALIDGFAGANFGLECAGVVRSVGAGVEDVKTGDRVMGFAPAALGTRVITPAAAVAEMPPGLDFAAAATLPVAFATVIYALGNLAQLMPEESVLVHAAAGGVGLAAIQYAKHRGAIVIATAGSVAKREFLRLAGADYVLDSRNLGFADAVREITGGAGVDVVLNSLGGEAMERSLEVLKPFGRFLELGKRDFYLNRRLHLRPLRQNISYFAIDVDQLPLRRPAVACSLLAEISALLATAAIRPLAHRVFHYSEVAEAFTLMRSSDHIGKLVLVPDADLRLEVRRAARFAARSDGTYLVTGGIDGFGFAAARWLAGRGAGQVALLGRRGPETPGCDERIAELRAAGAEVRVYRGDVADPASLAAVLDDIRKVGPPLRGVVHAAAAIDDRLAGDIDEAGIAAVLRPKLDGAVALDMLTRDDPVELFLLFSSATTMLGAPGQGAYVAANMTLEALARRRQAEGRPALAVAWGPIEDEGYLAKRPEARAALARRLGAKPVPAMQALAAVPAMLASGLPAIGCAVASWSEASRLLPLLATPLFSEIRSRSAAPGSDEALAERLRALEPEAAQALLRSVVIEETARILRMPAAGIDPLRPLSQIGIDSLMAVELRLALESRLHIDLPLVSLAEGTSAASIAARLGAALAAGATDADVAALAARHEAIDEPQPTAGAPDSATRSAAE